MNSYEFELEHDKGKANVVIIARNFQSAIQQIMNNEKCPESAIKSLELKGD